MRPITTESTYQASNPPVQVIEIENAEGEIEGKNGHVWHTKVDHALPRASRTPARNIQRIQKGSKGAARNVVSHRSCLELFITDAMEEICTSTIRKQ